MMISPHAVTVSELRINCVRTRNKSANQLKIKKNKEPILPWKQADETKAQVNPKQHLAVF